MGCGDSVRICALAAQQQGEPADQAVNVDETNCASGTHSFHKYSYRPAECKTFPQNLSRGRDDEHQVFPHVSPDRATIQSAVSIDCREEKDRHASPSGVSRTSSAAVCAFPAALASVQRPKGRCAWSSTSARESSCPEILEPRGEAATGRSTKSVRAKGLLLCRWARSFSATPAITGWSLAGIAGSSPVTARDSQILEQASSGGVMTDIARFLLERGTRRRSHRLAVHLRAERPKNRFVHRSRPRRSAGGTGLQVLPHHDERAGGRLRQIRQAVSVSRDPLPGPGAAAGHFTRAQAARDLPSDHGQLLRRLPRLPRPRRPPGEKRLRQPGGRVLPISRRRSARLHARDRLPGKNALPALSGLRSRQPASQGQTLRLLRRRLRPAGRLRLRRRLGGPLREQRRVPLVHRRDAKPRSPANLRADRERTASSSSNRSARTKCSTRSGTTSTARSPASIAAGLCTAFSGRPCPPGICPCPARAALGSTRSAPSWANTIGRCSIGSDIASGFEDRTIRILIARQVSPVDVSQARKKLVHQIADSPTPPFRCIHEIRMNRTPREGANELPIGGNYNEDAHCVHQAFS